MRRTSLAAAVVAIIVLIGGCGPGAPDVNATGSNMSKIQGELLMVATDDMRKRKLRDKEVLNAKGAEFAGAAMKAEILDSSLLSALVIPGTSDKAAPDLAGYTAANCSFCFPQGSQLLKAMASKGKNRKVLLCPNSKHWKEFGDAVPILFSDKQDPLLTTWKDLSEEFGITQADWENPGANLFGKKPPFDMVYE